MKRATFKVLFFAKWNRLLTNGDVPIYIRITVKGKSSETSLKRSVNPKLWDVTRNKAKGNSKEAKDLNDYLSSVRGQIYTHQQTLQEQGKEVTSKLLLNTFLGVVEKQLTLVELYQKHNDDMEQLVGTEYSPLTLQRYRAGLKHVKIFCKLNFNNEAFSLKEVNTMFIMDFEYYLKTKAKCQHNSAMKHVVALKKIIRIALANEYITKDPFFNYKITHKPVEREALTEYELNAIAEKVITIERLDIIRDLFLFQCYTGLAFKDLDTLKSDHIVIGIDGHKWISKTRGKTGVSFRIPLFPVTEKILNKYKTHSCHFVKGGVLPVPSNQKMNVYLKELADICGIKKNLHTHLARHTFATTVTLANNIPMETVSKLLGHTKLQTTQLYAKVLETKVSDEMDALREKYG